MARTSWPEGAEKHHSKCWYEPITDPEEASLALRFTLSQPVTAAIPPGHRDLFRLACDVAEEFQPITPEETEELFRRAQGLNPILRLAAQPDSGMPSAPGGITEERGVPIGGCPQRFS